jgi:hypothetical protein
LRVATPGLVNIAEPTCVWAEATAVPDTMAKKINNVVLFKVLPFPL